MGGIFLVIVCKVPRIINLKHLGLHPKTSMLVNLWDDRQRNRAKQDSIINNSKSKNAAKFLKRIRSRKLIPNWIRFIQEFIIRTWLWKRVEVQWYHPLNLRTSWEMKLDVSVQNCFYFHYLAMAGEKNEHKVKHSKSDLSEHYISKPYALSSSWAKLLSVNAYNLSSQLTSLIHHIVCENIKATQLCQVNSRVRQ